MPTPKQTRHHYEKILRAYRSLSKALNDAHEAKVLVYEAHLVGVREIEKGEK